MHLRLNKLGEVFSNGKTAFNRGRVIQILGYSEVPHSPTSKFAVLFSLSRKFFEQRRWGG